jgi:cation diffusion facilitator family transporter
MKHARYLAIKKANWVSAWVNGLQAILKTIVGLIGHSPALFADGIHSFADLLANLLVWAANKVSHVEPDENHPYGHGRFETVASLILGLFLIIVAMSIAYDAVMNVIHKIHVHPSLLTLVVAVLSIIANESTFRYTLHVANKVDSTLLRANAYHIRSDSLSSIVVFIGIIGALAGFSFFDAIAAALVAGFILKIGLQLAWQAIYELTDASVPHERIKAFEQLILGLSGVKHMHRLRTRKMAGRVFLDVHVLIEPYISASEGHYIAETVRVNLMKKYKEIEDITVHIDTEDHPETLPDHLPISRREIETYLPFDELSLDLYYFQTHIEARVTLPLHALERQTAAEWQAQIEKCLLPLHEIKKISLHYRAKSV